MEGIVKAAHRVAMVACLLLTACGGQPIQRSRARGTEGDAVAERAKKDLGCRWITVVHLGGDDFGADGCGLQATYTVFCGAEDANASCIAALNQQIR